jgi:uncharacterized protein YndB with AHSA1/START domain
MDICMVEPSIWIAAPCDQTWHALTQPAQLNRWYAANITWDIAALQTGATVHCHHSHADCLHATIAILTPPRQLTLHWHVHPQLSTTFHLEPINGGTRVTLTETGYQSMPYAERQQWLDQTVKSHMRSLMNLKTLLECGHIHIHRRLPYPGMTLEQPVL